MSFPYPPNISVRAQRAFLWATVVAIGDLHTHDQKAGQQFLSDLQFQIQHMSQIIPEVLKADREGLEALHDHLLRWLVEWSDTVANMTAEEREEGQQRRAFWKEVYETLDES